MKRLAELFRCSRQTVLRMVEQLQLVQGIAIESWMEGKERYYRAVPGEAPGAVSLTVESIRHLMLCRDTIRHLLPESLRQEIRNTIGKATILVPDSDDPSIKIESYAESLGKGFIDYTPFQGYLEDLQEAMQEHRLCRMKYRPRSQDSPRTYVFAPDKLLAFREALYARGWVCKEDGTGLEKLPRTFAVHRILGLSLLKKTLAAIPEAPKDDFFGFHIDEPFRVRVAFTKRAASYVTERKWSKGQRIIRHKNGDIELIFTSTSKPEVISWVLSFGADAELLEPKDIRKTLFESLGAAVASYSQGSSMRKMDVAVESEDSPGCLCPQAKGQPTASQGG